MIEQQYEDKQLLVSRVMAFAEEFGEWANGRYKMILHPTGPEIKVRDLRTGLLVAYSSTRADYASSLEEFAWDYFASREEA